MLEKIKTAKTINIIIIAMAIVAFWRGAWGLMDLYIFPDYPLLSYLTSILISLIILLVTRYITKLL